MSAVPVVWPDYRAVGTSTGGPWPAELFLSRNLFFSPLGFSRDWALGSGHDPGPLWPEWLAPEGRRGPHRTGKGAHWAGEELGLGSTPASVPWDGACDVDAKLRAAAELPLCGLRARRPPPDHAQPSPLSCAGGAVPAAPHGRRARRRSEQTWKASLNCKLASFIQHTLVVPSAVPKSHPAVQNRSKTSSVTRYDTMGAGGVPGVPGRGPRRARAVPGLAGIGGACARRARPVGLSGFLSSPGAVVLGQRRFCHRSVSPFGSGDQSGFPARCRRGLLPRSLCWALCGGCGLLPSVKFVF